MSNSIVNSLAHATALSLLTVIFNGMTSFDNITDAMAFYGVYHRNPINQIIHFFGVPCIIWSLKVFLCHLTIPVPVLKKKEKSSISTTIMNLPLVPTHELNYATILTMAYMIFYLKMDLFGGALYAPFAYLQYAIAIRVMVKDPKKKAINKNTISKKKYDDYDNENVGKSHGKGRGGEGELPQKTGAGGKNKALKLALLIHILGWYVQIHPGHAIYEGAKPAIMASIGGALTSAPLFAYYEGLWYFGLNKKLQGDTLGLVDVYTKELCQNGVQMRVCDKE